MISAVLRGGLGNQMFQYAAGRQLAIHHNTPLQIVLSELKNDTLRDFALGHFNIRAKVVDELSAGGRKFPFFRGSRPAADFNEPHFHFWPDFLLGPENCVMNGYWQSEKYFMLIRDLIRNEFSLSAPMATARAEFRKKILSGPSASVHIRRGDYVANPTTNAFHGTLSPAWYKEAMSRIKRSHPKVKFYVFSDDISWARQNLAQVGPTIFWEGLGDGKDHEDMHLMANCEHHVIANSSFSWWGAWLNANPTKITIAPQRWFASTENDTVDLLPHDWMKL